MSEKEETTILNTENSKVIPKETSEQNNTHDAECDMNNEASVEVNNQTEQKIDCDMETNAVAMDIKETETVELSAELQSSNSENKCSSDKEIINEEKSTTDQEMSTIPASVNKEDSTSKEPQLADTTADAIVESQPIANGTTSKAEQSKPQISNSIGSLKLLNQYDSSSDEDEDSSSSDEDSPGADSESDSDDSSETSKDKAIGTPPQSNMELNTLANNILNSVMSRDNYREVSSDS